MRIRYCAFLIFLSNALVSPLFAGTPKAVVEKKQEQKAEFVVLMSGFVKAEGLSDIFQPSYVCQTGREVCGLVTGNLAEFLKSRLDFIPDTYNFQRAHPGSTCSYRGKSGSVHYSLHIVCYGTKVAGVHMDIRLPEGKWGNIEHDLRDVAENYFKVYALRIKGSHTSDVKLARHFDRWWWSYETAYPESASHEIPVEAEEVLNARKHTARPALLQSDAISFR